MAWHPAETAPKDGEPFLAAIPQEDGKWEILRVAWDDVECKFLDATYDPFQDSAKGFTHWQALPAPPMSSSASC